jgi:hypothetical protein
MRNTSPGSSLNPAVVGLWQGQRTLAVIMPNGMRDCEELLPRVAAYYTYLKALPRRVRRALQRQWRMPLAGVALMLALGQSPGLAATIPVGGSCTLVNAITAANTDTATGGCPAGSGTDTIVLPIGSTQTLTEINNSTHGPTGLPVITSAITIEGQGSVIMRDGDTPFRIFAVDGSGNLTLKETKVSGGASPTLFDNGYRRVYNGGAIANYGRTVAVINGTISDSGNAINRYYITYGSGGGVFNKGTLTITDSTIANNFAYGGGGGGIANGGIATITNSNLFENAAPNGGGIANYGTLMLNNSTIASSWGGGVHSSNGALTIINSKVSGNTVGSGGSAGGVANLGGTLEISNSEISDNSHPYGNAGGISNDGIATINDSTIEGNSAREAGGGVGNFFYGTLAVANSTIANNFAFLGGGAANIGTLTITNSTITGNSAGGGGGVYNTFGTLTVANSTISGNSAGATGGGGVNNGGRLGIINSTISGNSTFFETSPNYPTGGAGGGIKNGGSGSIINTTIARNSSSYGGGGVFNHYSESLLIQRTLISGNVAPSGPEVFNRYGSVHSDRNIFGFNNTAGVDGLTPAATDIVPRPGVQLSNILNPVLAFNGGPTQAHALVPGSPAIDAGGAACTDANGNPLIIDQRGRPRTVDGNGDGIARCDIGAFEFFPVVNNLVTLDPGLDTSFDPTPVPGAPAGSFTIGATFTNTSGTALRFPFFTVTELSGGNLLLNSGEGLRGIGATITPNVGDQVLSPGETVQVDFVIGLQALVPFTFFVDLFGEPLVSGSLRSRQRPNVTAKGGRR